MHPPGSCVGRSLLIYKVAKLPSRRSRLRARRPPTDFGAAPPRIRPVWAAGGPRLDWRTHLMTSAEEFTRCKSRSRWPTGVARCPRGSTATTTACSLRRRLLKPTDFRAVRSIGRSHEGSCEPRGSATAFGSVPPSWTAGSERKPCRRSGPRRRRTEGGRGLLLQLAARGRCWMTPPMGRKVSRER